MTNFKLLKEINFHVILILTLKQNKHELTIKKCYFRQTR
jgi:hypothetical protein